MESQMMTQQLFDHNHADREFMVQPGDLPTITKLLGREIFDAEGEGCHQDKFLLIRKTFNGTERYLFQILLFFKNNCRRNMQFQNHLHTSKNILLLSFSRTIPK
jgi:hypothetical protein